MFDFLTMETASANPNLITVLYTMLLAFVLSSAIGITYEKTFRGLSYSRNYIQALILASIVAAMVMQAIGDSLARGLGMIGALAVVRFRTSFKDPRDIIFMFASFAAGISCGVFAYPVAVAGTMTFCLVAIMLYATPFGQTSYFDGILRFNAVSDTDVRIKIDNILKNYCKLFALVTLKELAQGKRIDYSYHIKLKKKYTKEELVNSLMELDSVKDINLMLQETTVEI